MVQQKSQRPAQCDNFRETSASLFQEAFPNYLIKETSTTWNGDRMFLNYELSLADQMISQVRLQYFPLTNSLLIGNLIVNKKLRRKGIGSSLVKALEDISRNSDIRQIRLFSRHTAVNFWRSCGFRHETTAKFMVKQIT